jgi:predicted TIM-barrel fold metal-dependent hydrolase
VGRYQELYGTWQGIELTPAEVLLRNFWFCAIEDPTTFRVTDRIGADNLLVESDYPHLDTTWPNTQQIVSESVSKLSEVDIRKITWENASKLFRHPVPAAVAADPNAY